MSDLAASGKLEIGRVIKEIFDVIGRNLPTFLILAVLLTGVPTAIVYALQGDPGQVTSPTQFGARIWGAVGGGLVAAMFALILQCAIIYATVSDLNGRRPSVADSLSVGLRAFLPVLLIGILFVLAYLCGIVLLIVPGIMIAVAWCVAVPAYVIERPPLTQSFARSAALTRGNRWRIFGLFCLYILAFFVIALIVGLIASLTKIFTVGGLPFLTRVILSPLINVVSGLLGAVGAAVLYVELRRLKDGVGPEGLAAIFD